VSAFLPRSESSKGFSPFRKAKHLYLPFCFFCLQGKEATLKSRPEVMLFLMEDPPILEGILGTALPFRRCFIALAQAPRNS